jgi:hypothetical protein
MSVGVTVWKILKTTKVVKKAKFPYFRVVDDCIYIFILNKIEKYEMTTKKYDDYAHKYLYIAFIPLLIGYTIYSLMYESHKGWYSFVLKCLVGFIYMFGFINMFP